MLNKFIIALRVLIFLQRFLTHSWSVLSKFCIFNFVNYVFFPENEYVSFIHFELFSELKQIANADYYTQQLKAMNIWYRNKKRITVIKFSLAFLPCRSNKTF